MSYIGNPIISTDFPKDTFSGNGSTTAFTMSIAPASVNAVIVVVSGITQDPSTYTISGTTLTFSAAPPTGTSNISVRHLGVAGIPNTPSAGSVVAASIADANITQVKLASGVAGTGPAFSAYSNVDQTGVVTNTWTKVLFQAEEYDTNSNFASSRFTPTVAGYYQITARTDWAITSGACFIAIYKNGTQYKSGALNCATSSGVGPTATGLVYCNGSTDYIEIYTYQNNGTNTIYSSSAGTFFQGTMVRAA